MNRKLVSCFILMITLLSYTTDTFAKILISGKITDCESVPLMGVVVETKGSKAGVSSFDGSYKILVLDSNAVIKYSLIEFEPIKIKVGKRKRINVKLESNKPLYSNPYVDKPVIYLYPETESMISLKVNTKFQLKTTYPLYKNGWKVLANPDGKIKNLEDNKEYSYLFWEGNKTYSDEETHYSKGFIVSGDSAITFLQRVLSQMGLKPNEYNEFIVFWLPILQSNKLNFVYFKTGEEYNTISTNTVHPKADVEIRVFMEFKKIDASFDLVPQSFITPIRKGFTLVEWGGTELKQAISVKESSGKFVKR